MNTEKIFGKNAYFYNKESNPEELLKLISYGIQQDDNGYIFLDNTGKCVYANRKAYSMFYVLENLDLLYEAFETWKRTLGIDVDATTWCRIYNSTGKERLYRVRFRRVHDESGKVVGSVYVIQNVSDSLEGEYGEQYRLTHDDLTQLYNKEGFIAAVRELFQSTPDDKEYVLVYSNIRDFKLINQLFGVDKGNDILVNIADAISQRVREEDVYGRINGDQFALCMPKERFVEADFKSAVKEVTNRLTSTSYSVHIQLGVYEIRDKDMDISLMCDRAYMACKSITKDGVCEIAWYSDDMLINALLEKEILSSFDFAIINRQFGIYLQPQVYADGKLFGAEALARWIDPIHGFLAPGDFIPPLEEAKLIHKVDRFIAEQVCREQPELKQKAGMDIPVSINLSRLDFMLTNVVESITDIVKKNNVDASNLHIEVTESALEQDSEELRNKMTELRDAGFEIWLDDFGSGYSSLNSLQDFRFDVIKVDMKFMRTLESNPQTKIIVKSIIEMTKNLKLRSLMEGVETQYQYDFIKEIGIDMAQGFLFSRPVPLEELNFN